MNLPKGTEHFLTDVHGEYEAFSHVLKNGSGSVRRKIEDVFGNTMSAADKKSLATLIYYPRAKMDLIRQAIENAESRQLGLIKGLLDDAIEFHEIKAVLAAEG